MKRSQWGENLSQVVVFELFVDKDVTKFISKVEFIVTYDKTLVYEICVLWVESTQLFTIILSSDTGFIIVTNGEFYFSGDNYLKSCDIIAYIKSQKTTSEKLWFNCFLLALLACARSNLHLWLWISELKIFWGFSNILAITCQVLGGTRPTQSDFLSDFLIITTVYQLGSTQIT